MHLTIFVCHPSEGDSVEQMMYPLIGDYGRFDYFSTFEYEPDLVADAITLKDGTKTHKARKGDIDLPACFPSGGVFGGQAVDFMSKWAYLPEGGERTLKEEDAELEKFFRRFWETWPDDYIVEAVDVHV